MKYWKQVFFITLLSGIIGVLVSPSRLFLDVLAQTSIVIVHIGRFIVFPMVLIGTVLGIYRLLIIRYGIGFFVRLFSLLVVLYIMVASIGLFLGITFVSDRIPPVLEETHPLEQGTFFSLLGKLFPYNAFNVFAYPGDMFFPLVIFSVVLGVILYLGERDSKIILVPLFETLWRGIWRFVHMLIVGLTVVMSLFVLHTIFRIKNIAEIKLYISLLVVMSIAVIFIIFVLYPLVVVFLKRGNFRTWTEAVTPVILIAFFSADILFCLPFIYKQLHENVKTSPITSAVVPVFSILFFRLGTIMVAGISFLVIFRSYNALEISVTQIFGIMGILFLSLFRLSFIFSQGLVVLLSNLSAVYIQGAESLYLVLFPIMMLLNRFAIIIDAATAILVSIFMDKTHVQIFQKQDQQHKISMLLED